jgi:hypothetical protein
MLSKLTKPSVKTISDVCENIELIDVNFKKCVQGYHLINASIIKESVWEDINSLIFSSVGIEVFAQSEGSHLPISRQSILRIIKALILVHIG